MGLAWMTLLRLDRAQRVMAREEISGLLLFNPFNIRYLTGHMPSMEHRAAAVLALEGDPWLIVPHLELEQAQERSWIRNVQPCSPYPSSVARKDELPPLMERVREALESLNLSSAVIGVELDHLSARRFEELKQLFPDAGFKDVTSAITELRMVKDEGEIERLAAALQIAECGVRTAIEFIRPGVSEIEVAAEVEHTLRRAGAAQIGFPTVIASGPRSAIPHAPASRREIGTDEFVVITVSAVYDEYCSVVARTVVTGQPSEKQRRLFECVRDTMETTLEQISPSLRAGDMDLAARKFAAECGYATHFLDAVGHGVGLQPREPPLLVSGNDSLLMPGMVLCLEPALYLQGLGGVRLGDTIVLQQGGGYNLLNGIPLDTI